MRDHPNILQQLRQDILPLEGYKRAGQSPLRIGCTPIEAAFPLEQFPTGVVHEFLGGSIAEAAASAGFISGMTSFLLRNGGAVVWIGTSRTIFPAALAQFGIDASNIIFIDVKKEQQALWATEEALKCNGLSTVVSEIKDLNFTNSRRFQLAVEQSCATGFIIHHHKKTLGVNACVARWRINPVTSGESDFLPGVLFPRWKVELLKVRNGQPNNWIIEWRNNQFIEIPAQRILNNIGQPNPIDFSAQRNVG